MHFAIHPAEDYPDDPASGPGPVKLAFMVFDLPRMVTWLDECGVQLCWPRPSSHSPEAASEVIRIREKAPSGGGREQVIRGQRVACHVPVAVQRVPAHGGESGPLTKLTGIDRDRREAGASSIPVRAHDRREVIVHRVAVREVDGNPLADRQERAETQLSDALGVESYIPAGVLVYERVDGGDHQARLCQAGQGRSTPASWPASPATVVSDLSGACPSMSGRILVITR